MITQTAFEAAFAKAGFNTDASRLAIAAHNVLGNFGLSPQRAFARFLEVVETDRTLLRALVYEYLKDRADDMRGPDLPGRGQSRVDTQASSAPAEHPAEDAGHSPNAERASEIVPASSPKADREGQCPTAEKANRPVPSGSAPLREPDGRFAHQPNPPRGIEAIKQVNQIMAISLMDSFKVRDGRAIGDVLMCEVPKLARSNEFEGRVLRAVQGFVANARPGATIRETIKLEELEHVIMKTRELVDAD